MEETSQEKRPEDILAEILMLFRSLGPKGKELDPQTAASLVRKGGLALLKILNRTDRAV